MNTEFYPTWNNDSSIRRYHKLRPRDFRRKAGEFHGRKVLEFFKRKIACGAIKSWRLGSRSYRSISMIALSPLSVAITHGDAAFSRFQSQTYSLFPGCQFLQRAHQASGGRPRILRCSAHLFPPNTFPLPHRDPFYRLVLRPISHFFSPTFVKSYLMRFKIRT